MDPLRKLSTEQYNLIDHKSLATVSLPSKKPSAMSTLSFGYIQPKQQVPTIGLALLKDMLIREDQAFHGMEDDPMDLLQTGEEVRLAVEHEVAKGHEQLFPLLYPDPVNWYWATFVNMIWTPTTTASYPTVGAPGPVKVFPQGSWMVQLARVSPFRISRRSPTAVQAVTCSVLASADTYLAAIRSKTESYNANCVARRNAQQNIYDLAGRMFYSRNYPTTVMYPYGGDEAMVRSETLVEKISDSALPIPGNFRRLSTEKSRRFDRWSTAAQDLQGSIAFATEFIAVQKRIWHCGHEDGGQDEAHQFAWFWTVMEARGTVESVREVVNKYLGHDPESDTLMGQCPPHSTGGRTGTD